MRLLGVLLAVYVVVFQMNLFAAERQKLLMGIGVFSPSQTFSKMINPQLTYSLTYQNNRYFNLESLDLGGVTTLVNVGYRFP